MHELSMMQSILDIALEFAAKHDAKKITKIYLEIGELSGVVPEWMQRYFDFVSEGTIAEKAQLMIEQVPAVIRCKSCKKEYRYTGSENQLWCRKCGPGSEIEILSGREFNIRSIEVE